MRTPPALKGAQTSASLPDILSVRSPDDMDLDGEISGRVFESADFDNGDTVRTGQGTYHGIMSGAGAGEIAGMLVITGDDPRLDGTPSYHETGGFIAHRP